MAVTSVNAFAAAIQSALQSAALKNLRDDLPWADRSLAEVGSFKDNTDTLMFRAYPDLESTTPKTPLTEATPPTARTISMTVTLVGTHQYGDLVSISDLVKTLAPSDVPAAAAERVRRTAAEVMDAVARDAIFLGGTPIYGSDDHTTRATLDNTDFLTGAHLIRFKAKAKKLNIPAFPGGEYRLYCSTEQAYDLQRETTASTSWLAVNQYSRPEDIIDGEMGKLHGVRIIAVNRAPTVTSSVTVHQAAFVGNIKGWGMGDLQTLQFYYTPPGGHGDELHQSQSVGWKCMWGAGVLNNGYFLRVESYASTL